MTTTRDELLQALYGTASKKELLVQFEAELRTIKGTSNQKYTQLLEQILYFSHAIIYGHKIQTAHNYRQDFMSAAKKLSIISDKEIEKAFSFLNRTEKKAIKKNKATEEPTAPSKEVSDTCIAKTEIERLKDELDTKSYKLSRGQKVEDKETYIKVALVALSTGAKLKEITETLELSTKRGDIKFINEGREDSGVILVLDIKEVRTYIKDIRKHFAKRAEETILSYKDKFKEVEKNKSKYTTKDFDKYKRLSEFTEKDIDINRAIRKATEALGIPNCKNTSQLNALYRECIN